MRILGIDPGTQYLGLGIIERISSRPCHVANFLLRPRDYNTLPEKLEYIFNNISEIIAVHKPQEVAIEGVFYAKNARSATVLSHARGVAMLCAARASLKVFEYSPASVKRAVGVSGAAEKNAVMKMVCTILKLKDKDIDKADCADALAIALCHLHRSAPLAPSLANNYVIQRHY